MKKKFSKKIWHEIKFIVIFKFAPNYALPRILPLIDLCLFSIDEWVSLLVKYGWSIICLMDGVKS